MSVMIHIGNGVYRPLMAACVPCPNSNDLQGVFVSTPLQVSQELNAARADRFARALDTDQFGSSFRGNSLSEPIYGAYGEKL